MSYLDEHRDQILAALGVLALSHGDSWETTAWVRSEADAETLREMLEPTVLAEVERQGGRDLVSVDRAQGPDGRHGVRITVRRPGK